MKHFIIILALLISPTVSAQLSCVNCANWWTQITSKYELVLQRAIQAEKLRVQLEGASRDIADGKLHDQLLTALPGYEEFAHAHRLMWATQDTARGLSKYAKTLEQTGDAFGNIMKKKAYSEAYTRWADQHKRATLASYKQMGLISDNLLDISKAREKIEEQLSNSESAKELAQNTASSLTQMQRLLEQLLSIMLANHKFVTDTAIQTQERAQTEQAKTTDARVNQVLGLQPTGDGVVPGQEFNGR